MGANKASRPAMTKALATILAPLAGIILLAGFGIATAAAGFRSPESLVRNVYAYYGDRSSGLSRGLPRNEETARQFFDPSLRTAWISPGKQPYDFFVQSPNWQIGAV